MGLTLLLEGYGTAIRANEVLLIEGSLVIHYVILATPETTKIGLTALIALIETEYGESVPLIVPKVLVLWIT